MFQCRAAFSCQGQRQGQCGAVVVLGERRPKSHILRRPQQQRTFVAHHSTEQQTQDVSTAAGANQLTHSQNTDDNSAAADHLLQLGKRKSAILAPLLAAATDHTDSGWHQRQKEKAIEATIELLRLIRTVNVDHAGPLKLHSAVYSIVSWWERRPASLDNKVFT